MDRDAKHTLPFLYHVANDILQRHGDDLSEVTLVFPNKRASLFINDYFAQINQHPLWSPSYTTISDLFRSYSSLMVPDDIKLVCELYRSFVSCTKSTESLDQFYSWGIVLLSDFNDIDKNLIDAHGLFTNLRDLHAYDNIDYLTETQKQVLHHFFQDFDEEHNSRLKEKFLQLWSRFSEIYNHYNQNLESQGLAYEGSLCRRVVESDQIDFGERTYIFVGFNALQEVERQLFKKLKREGKAEFYWDFDHYYQSEEESNEAGYQVRKYLLEFPNQLDDKSSEIYGNFTQEKDITYIGAPTGTIQARYVGEWLQDKARVDAGNRSAVVLCDENLLPTVIHSIPPSVENVNITTGFPFVQTAASSLITLLTEMAIYGQSGKDKYRQKFVLPVLRHPYAAYLSPRCAELCNTLIINHRFYPTREEMCLDEGLALIFRNLNEDPSHAERAYDMNRCVNRWLLDILRATAMAARQHETDNPLTHESLFRAYTLVNRLQGLIDEEVLKVDSVTYLRLLHQIMSNTTIPFHGEPAIGLQIMGVLETRNLDFDHLLILSCNEGNMPKGVDTPSFIPQSLRKAFGMTTIDHRVGIYAYNFFRLLQRAQDVTIMYGNAADDKNTGEKSRFLLQLMLESQHTIKRSAIVSAQSSILHERIPIEKTQVVMERLSQIKYISPTSINRYLRCPLQFFYNNVAGIKEPDTENGEIDNKAFGNIFHDASQFMYDELTGVDRSQMDASHAFEHEGHPITAKQIEYALNTQGFIERNLDKAMAKQLFNSEDAQNLKEINGLQIINRKVILLYLRQLLKIDKTLAPFTIRGLEGDVFTHLTINSEGKERRVKIGGRIDRMDEVTDQNGRRRIRVLDYKTGYKPSSSLKDVADIFDPANIEKHSDYYLQAMLYSTIVRRDEHINPAHLPVSPALLFIQRAGVEKYNPILQLDKKEIEDIEKYADEFEQGLRSILEDIFNVSQPFIPTEKKTTCDLCPYKQICGKNKTIA